MIVDLNVFLFVLIWTKIYLYFSTNHCQQDLFQYLAANNFTFVKKNLKIQDKFYIFLYVGGMMVLILVMLKPMRTNFYLPIPIKCRSGGFFSNQGGTSLCSRVDDLWVGVICLPDWKKVNESAKRKSGVDIAQLSPYLSTGL